LTIETFSLLIFFLLGNFFFSSLSLPKNLKKHFRSSENKGSKYLWGQGKPTARISANINGLSTFRYTLLYASDGKRKAESC
jgi:hypothetical protein